MKLTRILSLGVLFSSVLYFHSKAIAQEWPDPSWELYKTRMWYSFIKSPSQIDRCALTIVRKLEIDKNKDWPATCSYFENSPLVTQRVAELQEMINNLNIPEDEMTRLSAGEIWIVAQPEYVELSWGRPDDINRTITATLNSEQWVYRDAYIYIENKKVTAIQN